MKLLSIFHYVVGGLTALFSCFGLIYLGIGVAMVMAPETFESGDPPPVWFGWVFAIIGGSIVALGWILAGCVIAAGRFLAGRKHYIFCLVIAGIECMVMPFGTVLGVFTIVMLVQPAVKEMFDAGPAAITGVSAASGNDGR